MRNELSTRRHDVWRIGLAASLALAGLLSLQVFDRLVSLATNYPLWRIDVVITSAVVFGTATCVLMYRQLMRARTELSNRCEPAGAGQALLGLLAICCFCKSVSQGSGTWTPVEVYLGEHASVEFSHGVCPGCSQRHYPQYWPDNS